MVTNDFVNNILHSNKKKTTEIGTIDVYKYKEELECFFIPELKCQEKMKSDNFEFVTLLYCITDLLKYLSGKCSIFVTLLMAIRTKNSVHFFRKHDNNAIGQLLVKFNNSRLCFIRLQ